MKVLQDLGVEVKTHMSSIDGETAQLVEDALSSPAGGAKPEAGTGGDGRRTVEIRERATIKENLVIIVSAFAISHIAEIIYCRYAVRRYKLFD